MMDILSMSMYLRECYVYFMSHLSIGFFLPLKSYVERSSPIFSFHFLTRKPSVHLEFGRCGLGGCHDVVKPFRAFIAPFHLLSIHPRLSVSRLSVLCRQPVPAKAISSIALYLYLERFPCLFS